MRLTYSSRICCFVNSRSIRSATIASKSFRLKVRPPNGRLLRASCCVRLLAPSLADMVYGASLRHSPDVLHVEGLRPGTVKKKNGEHGPQQQTQQCDLPAVTEEN